MKLYVLTIFVVLVLLILPPAANAQELLCPTARPSRFVENESEAQIPISRSSLLPLSSVDSDNDVSPRVQDEDVKVPLVREPRDAFFDT